MAGTRSRDRSSPKIRAAADASAVGAVGWSGLPGARQRRLDGLPVSRGSWGRERGRQGAADAFPRRAGDRAVFTGDPPTSELVKEIAKKCKSLAIRCDFSAFLNIFFFARES